MTSAVDQMGCERILPTFNLIGFAFSSNHLWMANLIRCKYHRKIRKIHQKYLSGERNAESVVCFKVYRFLLLRKPEQ